MTFSEYALENTPINTTGVPKMLGFHVWHTFSLSGR